MITFEVIREEDMIHEITVEGHSNYKTDGGDIVCAAVSASVILTANATSFLDIKDFIDLKAQDGYFNIKAKVYNRIVEGLLRNLSYTLRELSRKYPRDIKIKEIQ